MDPLVQILEGLNDGCACQRPVNGFGDVVDVYGSIQNNPGKALFAAVGGAVGLLAIGLAGLYVVSDGHGKYVWNGGFRGNRFFRSRRSR